ncbi:MAG: DNA-3-methyladenine glycosylase 2 [Ruminococcaceae bacterium]|nr:DNA-3-methyladenine glycosylase 2 [Oscillospiraceae bacterium]
MNTICQITVNEFKIGDAHVVRIDGVKNFDVGKTFDCGQCFRFDEVKSSRHQKEFSGVAFGKFVSFAQDENKVYIYGSTLCEYENIWKDFLDIERDYAEVERDILSHYSSDSLICAIDYSRGIRILRQDRFESIISFIISQNNNIPRIKKIIEALSQECGEAISIGEEMKNHLSGSALPYAFPSAEAIYALGEQGLCELKVGFRAKYIFDAVSRILNGSLSLDAVELLEDTEQAIEMLCCVKGIGVKVASCALLFGFSRLDAFPIDVWIKRVGEKRFPEVKDFSGKLFGQYAGIAQQYLFYYERYNNI